MDNCLNKWHFVYENEKQKNYHYCGRKGINILIVMYKCGGYAIRIDRLGALIADEQSYSRRTLSEVKKIALNLAKSLK